MRQCLRGLRPLHACPVIQDSAVKPKISEARRNPVTAEASHCDVSKSLFRSRTCDVVSPPSTVDRCLFRGIKPSTLLRKDCAAFCRSQPPNPGLLDISNIREEPSLGADLSLPRESVAPIPANFPRCEEQRAIARPLLDLECKFEICLEL